MSGQLQVPTALPFGEKSPGTHWIGGRVGPRADIDAVEKRKIVPYRKSKPARPVRSPSLNLTIYKPLTLAL
jgi:hypothetical protein